MSSSRMHLRTAVPKWHDYESPKDAHRFNKTPFCHVFSNPNSSNCENLIKKHQKTLHNVSKSIVPHQAEVYGIISEFPSSNRVFVYRCPCSDVQHAQVLNCKSFCSSVSGFRVNYIPNLFRTQLRILPQRQCATFAAPLPDNPPSPTEHSSRGTEINARKHSAGCNTGVGKTVNISRGKFCILTDCTKAMVVSSRDGWVNLVFPAP